MNMIILEKGFLAFCSWNVKQNFAVVTQALYNAEEKKSCFNFEIPK